MLELLDQRIEQRLPARAIRTREVTGLTALSRSTLWRLRRRGQFPTPRRLSDGGMVVVRRGSVGAIAPAGGPITRVLRKKSRCGGLKAILVMETAQNRRGGDTMPVRKPMTG
jgi:predicted DNA-binding transcriptional regulator AlpA